jgi:hypothetical protein
MADKSGNPYYWREASHELKLQKLAAATFLIVTPTLSAGQTSIRRPITGLIFG